MVVKLDTTWSKRFWKAPKRAWFKETLFKAASKAVIATCAPACEVISILETLTPLSTPPKVPVLKPSKAKLAFPSEPPSTVKDLSEDKVTRA